MAASGPFDLSGRVALVTGGGGGVGRGITSGLLAAGATVAICARTPLDPGITFDGGSPHFFACDVREPEQVDAMVSVVVERFGRLDIAVNNAGGSPPADTATASPRFHTAIVALNLMAPLFVAVRANAQMQTQPDGGAIVNIASVNGIRPSPGTAAYGAAKAGLIHLTTTLAVEFAPKVRVNAVTAGIVGTDEIRRIFYEGDEARLAELAADVPMGRLADGSDVANACLFLVSSMASHVTGANLMVHGGGEPADSSRAGGTGAKGESRG
jgi:NAD(P)-dependent dehydrogenase (short-subunit alcohol dehydrogenase family)